MEERIPWYPGAIGQNRFVYFSSLHWKNPPGPDIALEASDYLYSNSLMSKEPQLGSIGIDNVLSYLSAIISSERGKENAFLSFLQSRKNLNLQPPSLDSDWSDFVKEIQNQLIIGEQGIKNLEREKKRLDANISMNEKNLEKFQNGDYNQKDYQSAQRGYTRSANYRTTEQMKKVSDFLRGNTKARTGQTIIKYIISHFGNSLLTLDANGQFKLNPKQMYSIILGASQIILNSYNSILSDLQELNKQSGKTKRYDITKDLEQVLSTNAKIDDSIRDMIESVTELPYTSKNLIKTYDIRGSARTNKDYRALADSQKIYQKDQDRIKEDVAIITADVQKYFSQHNIISLFDDCFKLNQTKNVIAEIQSQLNNMLGGALYSSRAGGAGGKTDVLVGYLQINAPQALEENVLTKYYRRLEDLSRQLEKLESTFSQKNTTEYYLEQEKNWNETIKEIDKIIESLKEDYEILANCFILEDSTKSYESLLVDKGVNSNNKKWESFSGGSIGANISDQLAKIFNLGKLGGISVQDQTWLLDACINAGPGMIGQHNKTSLEDYFSTMAAILMFDNQIGIINDAFNPPTSQTNVKQIHLFYANGGYFPLSYILQLTKEYLQRTYKEAIESVNQGAQAQLSGFVSHPPKFYSPGNPLTEDSWNKISEKAMDSVKINIVFLGGFLDLLNNLISPKLNN